MRGIRVWARLLGLQRAVVEDTLARARPDSDHRLALIANPHRGVCRRRAPGFDLGRAVGGGGRWISGRLLRSSRPRPPSSRCVVCHVAWARHRSRFTTAFEDQAAWFAVNTCQRPRSLS
jgi:hypothetical protein